MWDLIVVGGGSSGVAAAISAARNGCKTLIVEKNTFLGGTSTAALVTPMMKNAINDAKSLTTGIYDEILERLRKTGDSAIYKDGNQGWFNPEIMKCVLDDICEEENVKVLFDTIVTSASSKDNRIVSINCTNRAITAELKSKYFIDASGDANLAKHAGVLFESGENGTNQAMTLRFNMANIEIEHFASWLMEIDPDSGVSTVDYKNNGEILLSTAYTWDDKNWKLKPYFEKGINDGVITLEDSAYFQVFSMPGQRNSLSFNCPRIYAQKPLDPLNMWDTSYALTMGRKQIRRIAEFCIKYLPGFENAFISQIAPMLGVRDSRRIEGIYKLTENDIAVGQKFENSVAKSNYPVDVHSSSKNKSELTFLNNDDFYEIPMESLIPKDINNLLVIGRSISSTFKAQASLRIQPNCLAMGEAAGKFVADKIVV